MSRATRAANAALTQEQRDAKHAAWNASKGAWKPQRRVVHVSSPIVVIPCWAPSSEGPGVIVEWEEYVPQNRQGSRQAVRMRSSIPFGKRESLRGITLRVNKEKLA